MNALKAKPNTVDYVPSVAPKGAAPRFGSGVEHAKVCALIRALHARGFAVHSVAHEDYVSTPTEQQALWEVFEVGESTLRFTREGEKENGKLFGVLLIVGNGEDIISDYSLPTGALDWADAMEKAT